MMTNQQEPALRCPVCSQFIPLDSLLHFEDRRLMVCTHCHHREEWVINTDPNVVIDLRSDVEEMSPAHLERVWADITERLSASS
jgi:hypothetical protein